MGAKKPTSAIPQQQAAEKPKRRDAQAMKLSNICPDPKNCRRLNITLKNDPKLQELADSIKQVGNVIQPIIVRLRSKKDLQGEYYPKCSYMIISGHRRFEAAKLVGLETIHCIIFENLSDKQAFEMQIVENLHRLDLQPIEEASAYFRMKVELGYTYKEIALRVGKNEKHIGRYMNLLDLPQDLKEEINTRIISLSKAQIICSLSEAILSDILLNRRYLLHNNYTTEETKKEILRIYTNSLDSKGVYFDPSKEYQDEEQTYSSCKKCQHKRQALLFEEFSLDTDCPFAPCFHAKNNIAKVELKIEDKEDDKEDDEEEEEMEEECGGNKVPTSSAKEFKEHLEKRQLEMKMENKIQEAIHRAKTEYYLDVKKDKGFSPADFFFLNQSLELLEGYGITLEDMNYYFEKYIGKDPEQLKENGTYEELFAAAVVYKIFQSIDDDEDEIAEWLNCEQCPDELIENARKEAQGIKC